MRRETTLEDPGRREAPRVLVVGDDPRARRIATILDEAGIVVTAVRAIAETPRRPYDLAIVAGSSSGESVAALRSERPELDALDVGEADPFAPAPALDPRRFVGRVRERLLCGRESVLAEPEERAEACIAAAKLACLHRRRRAARDAGAHDLAAALRREIGQTRAERRALLRFIGGPASPHRPATDRRGARLR